MKKQQMKPHAKQKRQPAGQGIVEYLIIISLVALAIVVIINVMQPVIGGVFSDFVDNAAISPPNLSGFTRVAPTVTPTPDTTLTLTVNYLPDPSYGNVSRSPTGPTYDFGTEVTLDAIPESGYGFSHWSGDLDTTDNPALLTMDSDKMVDANFAPCFDVTTVADPVAGGTVDVETAPNCDGGQYMEDTEVTFTANPASGYVFDEWDNGFTNSSRTITVDGDEMVTAYFASSTDCYTLTTNTSGGDGSDGSVDILTPPNCGSDQYNAGTDVTIEAIPADGYEFDAWSGDLATTDNPAQIDMSGDRTVTANFVTETYEITIAVNGNGSVSKTPDQAVYDPGDVVRLTANPGAGWEFDGWTGDATGSSLNVDVTMDGDKSVTAHFGEICYTLTTLVDPDDTGSVSVSPAQNCSGGYTAGTNITIEAIPAGGYEFDEWTGDVTGSTNPETFTINEDRTVTANFVAGSIACYTLSSDVDPAGGGTVTADTPNCGDRYEEGTVVGITASPATGHVFNSWIGDVVSGNASETITMNGDKAVTAKFDPLCYDVTTTASPGAGGAVVTSPAPNCNGDQYNYGTDVTFTANANSGYAFDGWSGDLSGFTNPDTLTIDSNVSVIANFLADDDVLFVVDTTMNSSDQTIHDRLVNDFGYTVTVVDDDAVQPSDADGKLLIIISSTVTSGDVGNIFRDTAVPVILWENALLDDMEMVSGNGYGTGSDNQGEITIVNNSHPLAAGLSAGDLTVTSGNNTTLNYSYGEPLGSAILIATEDAPNTDNHVIFAYEAGATLNDGSGAAARRVMFFMDNNTADDLNADGWSLFDAAVNWAVGNS